MPGSYLPGDLLTKIDITSGPQSDEIVVLPTRALTREEGDWAVAFAVPSDTERLYLSTRPAAPRPRQTLEAPFARFGDSESFCIFDDVFENFTIERND